MAFKLSRKLAVVFLFLLTLGTVSCKKISRVHDRDIDLYLKIESNLKNTILSDEERDVFFSPSVILFIDMLGFTRFFSQTSESFSDNALSNAKDIKENSGTLARKNLNELFFLQLNLNYIFNKTSLKGSKTFAFVQTDNILWNWYYFNLENGKKILKKDYPSHIPNLMQTEISKSFAFSQDSFFGRSFLTLPSVGTLEYSEKRSEDTDAETYYYMIIPIHRPWYNQELTEYFNDYATKDFYKIQKIVVVKYRNLKPVLLGYILEKL